MKINENIWISKKKDGSIWSNLSGEWKEETDTAKKLIVMNTFRMYKSKDFNDEQKEILLKKYIDCYNNHSSDGSSEDYAEQVKENKDKASSVCSKLIEFFKDFDFEPNFRFVNTLYKHSFTCEEARDYVVNYFNLTDNSYKEDISEKTKSYEFKDIINTLSTIVSDKTVNSRFKLYYGSQGTGKTTAARKEVETVVVCHSAMLPSDLLEDFKFEEGKAAFKKSALWIAMEEGKKIVLDEINLLPYESLRFLQTILDDKPSINYKGQTINIKDGFQIIGTMNLVVNGSVFGLPEPLVDRASELKEYKLTAEQLVGALI